MTRRRNGTRGSIRAVLRTWATADEIQDVLDAEQPWDDEGVEVYETTGGNVIVAGGLKYSGGFYPGPDGMTQTLAEVLLAVLEDAGDDDGSIVEIAWME